VISDIVEVVVVDLLGVDDLLEELHADTVTVVATHLQELVVGIDGVILEPGVEGKAGFHRLAFLNFGGQVGGGFAVGSSIRFKGRLRATSPPMLSVNRAMLKMDS
jgi:hypothetical protein